MKTHNVITPLFFAFCIIFHTTASAVNYDNAAVVSVRKDCNEGSTQIDNCFEGMSALYDWITITRQPKNDSPLLVNIGPGNFQEVTPGDFSGQSAVSFGDVTYRGAGRNRTIIGSMTIIFDGNARVAFEDLTIRETQTSGYAVAATSGDSIWTNVLQDGDWNELVASGTRNKHYWYASKIQGTYHAKYDESWFYGSELSSVPIINGTTYNMTTLWVEGTGEVHVYGGNINANKATGSEIADNTGHGAVFAEKGGKIHIHGTGIDVISTTASDIYAIWADTNATVHANQTAYNLSTQSGGNTWRLFAGNGATISAPYHWGVQTGVPDVISIRGADTTIEVHRTGTLTPFIYATQCAGTVGGPWLNQFTNACRDASTAF